MRYLISADGPPILPVMGGGGWPPRAAWRSSWVGNDELVSRAGMGRDSIVVVGETRRVQTLDDMGAVGLVEGIRIE
jgi:hypothetical protein